MPAGVKNLGLLLASAFERISTRDSTKIRKASSSAKASMKSSCDLDSHEFGSAESSPDAAYSCMDSSVFSIINTNSRKLIFFYGHTDISATCQFTLKGIFWHF
jgi:hypothetical protein